MTVKIKNDHLFSFWISLTIQTVIISMLLTIISCYYRLFSVPSYAILALALATVVICAGMNKSYCFIIIRRTGIAGGLLIPQVFLVLVLLPAMFIIRKYSQQMDWADTITLFSSITLTLYLVLCSVTTLPAVLALIHGYELFSERRIRRFNLFFLIFASVLITIFFLLLFFRNDRLNATRSIFFLPPLTLLLILSFLVAYRQFRKRILPGMEGKAKDKNKTAKEDFAESYDGVFKNILLFKRHYFEIISGNNDYILKSGDEGFAATLIQEAIRNFDPALLPALKIIASSGRFSEKIQKSAISTSETIEEYFRDPVRNRDLIIQSGLTEKVALAKHLIANDTVPPVHEVLKILHDSDPVVRRIGLAIIGRFKMEALTDEVIKALSIPETEKEAFYLLGYMGPEMYGKISEHRLKHSDKEKISLMIIKLLTNEALPDMMTNLSFYFEQGTAGTRLEAIKYMDKAGYKPTEEDIERLIEVCNEVLGYLARIVSFQLAAGRKGFYLIEKALGWEREMNIRLLFSVLPYIIGTEATGLLERQMKERSRYNSLLASETVRMKVPSPLKRLLLAYVSHNSDHDRLKDMSRFIALPRVTDDNLAQLILSSDRSIAGIWTKACTLRKIAEGSMPADKELLISFLFSQRKVLQEEGARAILHINKEWYYEIADRLPDIVRKRTDAVINSSLPDVAMIFDKTRFLNLCFGRIPEDRLLYLAAKMQYFETNDVRPLPGILSWIVPTRNGDSGLYSISVNVLTDFLFHYSEYTDIFVEYIDNADSETAIQNATL